jgi:NDP-sugar pyrophosphorylase family protein
MRAIILAGGIGTRLRPFTTLIPKPLVPIGNKYSILEILIRQLVKNNFSRITIAVNHLSHLIESYFGDGKKYGVKIDYSLETKSLGTIGPLKIIKDLPKNFLVVNGDILTNLNFKTFFKKHLSSNKDISVCSFKRQAKIDYGVIKSKNNKLLDFDEKPTINLDVSMGIYYLNKNILKNIKNNFFGFDDLMKLALKKKISVNIMSFNGLWLDIGRVEDYENANLNHKKILKKINF